MTDDLKALSAPKRIWVMPEFAEVLTNRPRYIHTVEYVPASEVAAAVKAEREKADVLIEALERAEGYFYEIANQIDDTDYCGKPDGCNAEIHGHFAKCHKMHVQNCTSAAERVRAAIRAREVTS